MVVVGIAVRRFSNYILFCSKIKFLLPKIAETPRVTDAHLAASWGYARHWSIVLMHLEYEQVEAEDAQAQHYRSRWIFNQQPWESSPLQARAIQ
jgi:hypothetical protein